VWHRGDINMGLDINEYAICACKLIDTTVEGHCVAIVELLLLKDRPTLTQDIGVATTPKAEAEVPDQPCGGVLKSEDLPLPKALSLGDFGEVLLRKFLWYQ
jgi:hypothetical protein